MADVSVEGQNLEIRFSLLDKMIAFRGNMSIPLSHVTNAYVSSFEQLALSSRVMGVADELAGQLKMDGVFRTPEGIVFADLAGAEDADCLVVETTGERYRKIALTLPAGQSPNEVAHRIMAAVPDSGPDEAAGNR